MYDAIYGIVMKNVMAFLILFGMCNSTCKSVQNEMNEYAT